MPIDDGRPLNARGRQLLRFVRAEGGPVVIRTQSLTTASTSECASWSQVGHAAGHSDYRLDGLGLLLVANQLRIRPLQRFAQRRMRVVSVGERPRR
jgi:hypothetical protein